MLYHKSKWYKSKLLLQTHTLNRQCASGWLLSYCTRSFSRSLIHSFDYNTLRLTRSSYNGINMKINCCCVVFDNMLSLMSKHWSGSHLIFYRAVPLWKILFHTHKHSDSIIQSVYATTVTAATQRTILCHFKNQNGIFLFTIY